MDPPIFGLSTEMLRVFVVGLSLKMTVPGKSPRKVEVTTPRLAAVIGLVKTTSTSSLEFSNVDLVVAAMMVCVVASKVILSTT